MSDHAFAVNQGAKLQNLILNETESGNSNKAPRLLTMDDYSHWKNRFEIHINGVDTHLWTMIEEGYTRPMAENGTPITLSRLTDLQRKDYDAEKKAYAILSQSIPREIFHQFRQFVGSKSLWEALEQRSEGNAALKTIKSKALKKEFESFSHIGNESLEDIFTRFYHLLSELHAHGITTTREEKVQCLADGLPPKWDQFLMVLKQTEALSTLDINEFIQKLKEQEVQDKYKAKRGTLIQDPSLYYSNPSASSSPAHAPLQTAFVSDQGAQGYGYSASQDRIGSNASASTSATAHQQAHAATATQRSTEKLQTDILDKVTVEITKEHMAMLSALVSSYGGVIAGEVGNCHLTDEDYAQIDKDEMDRMDIMWALASGVRRAKEYVKRTGKELSGNRDSKYGFDKAAITCYNCGKKGHFARECDQPRKTGNRYPFNPQRTSRDAGKNTERSLVPITNAGDSGSSGSKDTAGQALAVQKDEGMDWSFRFTSTSEDADANIAEIQGMDDTSESDSGESADGQTNEAKSDRDDESSAAEIVDQAAASASEGEEGDADSRTNFALMADTTSGVQVCPESSSENFKCLKCVGLEEQVEGYRSHNASLVEDLSQCLEANQVLKDNEKAFTEKVKDLTKQVHELEIGVLNKQDSINFRIDIIDGLKRELALLKVDYDTLKQKLNSYASSSYLLEHMLKKRPGDRSNGIGYNLCPPPVQGINHPRYKVNDAPIKDHVVSTPLVVDPVKLDVSKTDSKDKGVDVTDLFEPMENEVEHTISGNVYDEDIIPGLGSTSGPFSHQKKSNHSFKLKCSKPGKASHQQSKASTSGTKFVKLPPLKPVTFVKVGETARVTKTVTPAVAQKKVSSGRPSKPNRTNVYQNTSPNFTERRNCSEQGKLRPTKPNHSTNVYQNVSPNLAERRSCFECGEKGHVVSNCPYPLKPYRKVEKVQKAQKPIAKSNVYKQKSTSPVRPKLQQGNAKGKAKVHEVSSSGSESPTAPSVKQTTVYHKQSMHKRQTWKSKTDEVSGGNFASSVSSTSSQLDGQWVDVKIADVTGKPKTVKAWVPISN